MKRSRAAGAFLLLGGAAAFADVMALDLKTMVQKYADVAVVGAVEAVTYSEFPLDDGSPAAYTNLVVKGESLYTGKPETVTASFVGGYIGGDRIYSSEEPTAVETQVGRRVVVFSSPWPSTGNAPPRCLVAQHAGIFLVQPGPQGEVVLGKGEGFAIARNVLLKDLQSQAAELWRTRPQPPQKPK
ncbi:MAG TPA: hypothetical protein VFI25_15250 [Planctomycetota bacterium]|jgi:hypothetical protein|nr:hypothetical protein [Planctomycetota bacterium]